jgi:hypothetical protein
LYHAHEGESEPTHPSNSENDWNIITKHSIAASIEQINDLWKFAQKRMSAYPNVQSKYKITMAEVEHMCGEHKGEGSNSGDLTVMICSIIPISRKEQSLLSPKGVLRIWDGTGMPCCDP